MADKQKKLSKADVQTTERNKLPVPGKFDSEFSAEEAAEVFKQKQSAHRASNQQE